MLDQKAQIRAAIDYLIDAEQAPRLIREVTALVERWSTRPMYYAGELSILNALIDLGLANREAYDRVIGLIEAKRRLRPEARRVDYQAKIMRERRARQNKALELHALVTGAPVTGKARAAFVKDLLKRWAKERGAFIRAKGELSWADRNAAANEFWAEVDAKLDKNIEEARLKKPRRQDLLTVTSLTGPPSGGLSFAC